MLYSRQREIVRLAIAAALLLSPALVAQADAVAEQHRIEQLLSSPTLTERAWGAYWAGRVHEPSVNELLLRQFSDAQSYTDADDSSEEYGYVLTLFDALIQAGMKVPADLLMPFKDQWRDEVLILLARDSGNEDLLLELRDQKLSDGQWLTVNNLLFRMNSARWLATTLRELKITHKFTVVDANVNSFGEASGTGIGGAAEDGTRELPKGFPPIGLYELSPSSGEEYVLVAKGPRDAYYSRKVVPTNGRVGWGISYATVDVQQENLRYLAAVNEMTLEQAIPIFWATSTIHWYSPESFQQQVAAALGNQATAIQAFADNARRRGIESLTGINLEITLQINDERRSRMAPLPLVEPLELAIQ